MGEGSGSGQTEENVVQLKVRLVPGAVQAWPPAYTAHQSLEGLQPRRLQQF